MPFDGISKSVQAGENDCEIASTLGTRRFEQTIDILKQHIFWMAHLEKCIDAPPQHAFLAFNAGCEQLSLFSAPQVQQLAGSGLPPQIAGRMVQEEVVARYAQKM